MLFLSTATNRIDKKGRVSVPAAFRQALASEVFVGIVAYASLRHPCIEACGMARVAKMNAYLESLPPFSEERDALATVLFGESVQLAFDSEGRVMLPSALLAAAGISEDALFVGKGEVFEVWEPAAYRAHAKHARTVVKQQQGGKR